MFKKQGTVFPITIFAVLVAVLSWGSLLHAQQPSPDPQPPTSQTEQASPPQPSPNAQTPPPQTPDQSGQQAPDQSRPDPSSGATPSQSQAQSPDPGSGQVFTGTVVKKGDKYMLQGEDGTAYDIDHQAEVSKFEGKRIRVHGTLDSSGKMIHVQ